MDRNLDNKKQNKRDERRMTKVDEIQSEILKELLNKEDKETHSSYFIQKQLDKKKEEKMQKILDLKSKIYKKLKKVDLDDLEEFLDELEIMEKRCRYLLEKGL